MYARRGRPLFTFVYHCDVITMYSPMKAASTCSWWYQFNRGTILLEICTVCYDLKIVCPAGATASYRTTTRYPRAVACSTTFHSSQQRIVVNSNGKLPSDMRRISYYASCSFGIITAFLGNILLGSFRNIRIHSLNALANTHLPTWKHYARLLYSYHVIFKIVQNHYPYQLLSNVFIHH